MEQQKPTPESKSPQKNAAGKNKQNSQDPVEKEIGGFKDSGLPEPTRFGDWEVKGRCSDF